jgi:hypothetical protein
VEDVFRFAMKIERRFMTDAKQRRVDAFHITSHEDLRLLVTDEELQELLKAQRQRLKSRQLLAQQATIKEK